MLLAVLFLAMAVASAGNAQQPVERDESAVYAAVIAHLFLSDDHRQVVVRRETASRTENGRGQEELATVLEAIPAAAFAYDDFRLKNARSVQIESDFPLRVAVRLVSEADLLGMGGKQPTDYWARFYDRYPDSPGYLIFSRPGYSHDRRRALVYVYRACGPLCRESRYVLLRKEQSGWRLIESILVE